jgi:hypothetical protein
MVAQAERGGMRWQEQPRSCGKGNAERRTRMPSQTTQLNTGYRPRVTEE